MGGKKRYLCFVCSHRALFLVELYSAKFYIQILMKVEELKPMQTGLKVKKKKVLKIIVIFLLMTTKLNWPKKYLLTNAKIYFTI